MKVKFLLIAFAFVSLFLISNCSPKLDITLFHQADDSVNYSNYHSFEYYGWADSSDRVLTQMDKRIIETSFGKQFKERELEYVKENGDLIVTLFIVTEQKTETQANTYYSSGVGGYGYGGYYGGYGGYYGYGPGYGWNPYMGSTTVYSQINYTTGTLLISIYDARKKILIYEAVAMKNSGEALKKDERTVDLISRSMMYNFPIKPVGAK